MRGPLPWSHCRLQHSPDSIPRLNPQETLPSHSQEQSPLVQVKMKEEKRELQQVLNKRCSGLWYVWRIRKHPVRQPISTLERSVILRLSDYHQHAWLSGGFYMYQHKGCLQIFCSLSSRKYLEELFCSSEDAALLAEWAKQSSGI